MGVFIGAMVLIISLGLVVLMALSEWYDFDLGSSSYQAATKAVVNVSPSRRSKPAKRRKK